MISLFFFPVFLFSFFPGMIFYAVVQASNSYIQNILLREAGGSLVFSPDLEGCKAWIPPSKIVIKNPPTHKAVVRTE